MKWLPWWQRYQRMVLVLLFMLVLLGLVQLTGLRQHLNLAYLRQMLLASRWQGLALFVLLFSIGNLVQVPGWIFLASAVLVLGQWGGGIVTYLAASVSCAVTFLSVRLVGDDAMQQMQSPLAKRLLSQLHAHPVRNVVALRVVFQTLAALNYALAMSGISFRKYMAASLLGLPLPIAVYCVFFNYVEHAMHLQ
jgi:uncharacterized membrane protein YdjX (TVP38/TMEM64 family)